MEERIADEHQSLDDSTTEQPPDDDIDLGAVLRGLRRTADLSQRQLAVRAKVSRSAVARIECGAVQDPRFRGLERLVVAAGGAVQIVDSTGSHVTEIPHEDLRDMGERHFPAHLDVRAVENPED